ncbi:hypothetical protein [Methanobrevibacter sp.]|uniref:hypothetical protein n=1 Tax=Methanobrevibacter sp. TaxID=66852 RepID=UPI0038634533
MAHEDRIIKKYNYFNKGKQFSGPTVNGVSNHSSSSKTNINKSNSTNDLINFIDMSISSPKKKKQSKNSQNKKKKKKKKPKYVCNYKFSEVHHRSKKPLYDYEIEEINNELKSDALNQMDFILNLISKKQPNENNKFLIKKMVEEINSFIQIHKLFDIQVQEKNKILKESYFDFENNKM